MGTNYYWIEAPPCACCKRVYAPQHIGKASMGWCFSLHVDPESGPRDLADWAARFATPGSRIEDEYGNPVSAAELLRVITDRRGAATRIDAQSPPFDYARNNAVPGPHGLLRAVVDGHHCIGHGHGTWDLITGAFS